MRCLKGQLAGLSGSWLVSWLANRRADEVPAGTVGWIVGELVG